MIRTTLAILCVLACFPGLAQVPQQINFQGQLVSADGTPLPDGSYELEFEIFSDLTAGDPGTGLWTEQHTVTLSGGVFSVSLGATTSLDGVFSDGNRFIEVRQRDAGTTDAFLQAGPRQQILSVPYAHNAEMVEGNLVCAGIIDLAANTVVKQYGGTGCSGWIASVEHQGTGTDAVRFKTDLFADIPVCTHVCQEDGLPSTSGGAFSVDTYITTCRSHAGSLRDKQVMIQCIGPKGPGS